MRGLSSIIWMNPKPSVLLRQRQRGCGIHKGGGGNGTKETESPGSDVATREGMPAAPGSRKRYKVDSPQSIWREPCQHLDFCPVKLMLNFWLQENSLVLHDQVFGKLFWPKACFQLFDFTSKFGLTFSSVICLNSQPHSHTEILLILLLFRKRKMTVIYWRCALGCQGSSWECGIPHGNRDYMAIGEEQGLKAGPPLQMLLLLLMSFKFGIWDCLGLFKIRNLPKHLPFFNQ